METSSPNKNRTTIHSAIPLLSIYPEKTKTLALCSIFIIAKIWKQPRCLLRDEGVKMMWGCGGYKERLLNNKEE